MRQPDELVGGVGVTVEVTDVTPAGSQPPLTHVPPPIATNGSGVVQPPGYTVVGGGDEEEEGVVENDGADELDPVVKMKSGEVARAPTPFQDVARK